MKYRRNILLGLTTMTCILAGVAYAQTKLSNPTPAVGTLQDFIDLLITIVQSVLMPVVVVCVIYGGYLMVTAGDNEAARTKAKGWILWSVVGAAIIMSALEIAQLIKGTVTSI